MRPVRGGVFAAWFIGGVILSRHWGWGIVAAFASTLMLVPVVDRRKRASAKPEYWLMLLALSGIAALGVSAFLSGGAHSPTLSWLAVPVVAATVVFGLRGAVLCLGAAMVTTLVVAVTADTSERAYDSEYLVAVVVLLIAVGLYVYALMRTEIHHRRGAVIDPLTGLLNRSTLGARFHELGEQARVAGAPVAMAILDLDHFKRVNDEHGHERGDAVLREVAYELRKALRTFELAYRLGGEEFLVLLPGLDETAAVALVDDVRARVAAAAPGGLPVTVSAGVAAAAGNELTYEALFALADERLYAAKRAGRNRVLPQRASAPVVLAAG